MGCLRTSPWYLRKHSHKLVMVWFMVVLYQSIQVSKRLADDIETGKCLQASLLQSKVLMEALILSSRFLLKKGLLRSWMIKFYIRVSSTVKLEKTINGRKEEQDFEKLVPTSNQSCNLQGSSWYWTLCRTWRLWVLRMKYLAHWISLFSMVV